MQLIERSADHQFTHAYSQPAGYHFCWDSVIFPRFVAERAQVTEQSRVLDLCSGCGVIGFELAHHLPVIQHLDFVEVQEEFLPHFETNLALTKKNFKFLNMNYSELLTREFASRYDLVVANPPYFHSRDGKLSPVTINNRARFFIDSNFETLIAAVCFVLAPGGRAYLLAKSGAEHGRDSFAEIQRIIENSTGEITAHIVADIRGTKVVEISKILA